MGEDFFLAGIPARKLMLVFDSLTVAYFAFIDSQGKSTVRVGANPCFECHGSALLPIIR
jgi:hypothetical protein